MKLAVCCSIAALLAATSASAIVPVFDAKVWAVAILKEKGIEDAQIVEIAFPITFTYCPKDSPALWRYQLFSPSQVEALNRGALERGEELPASGELNYELIEANSPACTISRS